MPVTMRTVRPIADVSDDVVRDMLRNMLANEMDMLAILCWAPDRDSREYRLVLQQLDAYRQRDASNECAMFLKNDENGPSLDFERLKQDSEKMRRTKSRFDNFYSMRGCQSKDFTAADMVGLLWHMSEIRKPCPTCGHVQLF